MRIVAGIWRGRILESPGGKVRPTQDRVRQVLFDILGAKVQEGAVLDLYAGTGALGLEALSRGASGAVFVEADRRARAVLERNCAALQAGGRARVLGMSVGRALALLEEEGEPFRWIVADPPYGDPGVPRLLEFLGAGGSRLLPVGGGLVLECRSSELVPDQCGRLRRGRERRLGQTSLHFYIREGRETEEGRES